MTNISKFKYRFVLLLLHFSIAKCANILAIFPSPGYSQYILVEPLLVALAQREHNVTVISAFESKNVKNLTNIVVDVSLPNDKPEILFQLQDASIFANIKMLNEMGLEISEKLLADKRVQELISSDVKFDLVLVETFFNEAHQAFANHFNAHQVLFHSMAINEWNSHLVANPNVPSYLPNSFGGYTTYMTLSERFRNTLALWFDRLYKSLIQYPAHQKLVDKYFPGKHNLDRIMYNASLMLTCSHVSTAGAVPLTTSVVEIGGLHVTNKKLPNNVKEFLDSAKYGAIFFSLGSNIKSSTISREIIQDIFVSIGKLKQKVLWKFEDDKIENKPDNLMISDWFPQSDILAHPNTIIFISHCGMGSTTETVYHGVPVVGIPIYGDQFMNVRKLVQFGMAVELPFKQLSGKTLGNSIEEILHNIRYRENAKRRSSIMKDRPMKPLDLAVYWIEYVLRQDGAHHLKNSILDLAWYELHLLDVIAVTVVSILAIIYSIFVAVKFSRRRFATKTKLD